MEDWCSHCCRLVEIIIESNSQPGYFVSSCTLCGKLLADLCDVIPLQMIRSSKKRRDKTPSTTVKRVTKSNNNVKLETTDSESSVSVDPIVKEEKQSLNSNTLQTSDNN